MKHQLRNVWMLIFLSMTLAACQGQQNAENETNTEEEPSNQEQVDAVAMERGKEIASASQKALASNLKRAIKQGGIAAAFKFCNVEAMPLTDSLSEVYEANVKRASLWVRNPKDEANEVEREILEAYHEQMQASNMPKPRVINLDEDYVLYTQPIAIKNGLCLNCHGEVGKQVQQETYQLIKERYPDDQATGHKMGDLRGIWSIRFEKSSLTKDEVIGMLSN